MSWHCGAVGLGVDFAVDGLRLKGFESRLGRVFQTCVCISYHDNVTKTILNQDSKLGCTSIENGYSLTTVDYLAIVDYSPTVDYPQITSAKMKGNVPQCGLNRSIADDRVAWRTKWRPSTNAQLHSSFTRTTHHPHTCTCT